MAPMYGLFFLVLSVFCPTSSLPIELSSSPCVSQQYLSLGQTGTIECHFSDFYGVFWYNSTDYERPEPFFYYTQGKKSGDGFSSGEFDIHPNGSLIIANVSLQHDHVFTVIMYESILEDTKPHRVEVIVTVIPNQKYPLIDVCIGKQQCFIELQSPRNLTCEVRSARPEVNVTFYAEETTRNRLLPGPVEVEEEGVAFNSVAVLVNTSSALNYNTFGVVSCISSGPAHLLEMDQSLVLLQHGNIASKTAHPVLTYIEFYKDKELTCGPMEQPLYRVWKKQMSNGLTEHVTAIAHKNETFVLKHSEKYDVNTDHGRLTIRTAEILDEGIFVCVYGDGINETIVSYNVSVYVMPQKKYLDVQGCSPEGQCFIPTKGNGTLTCSVFGIRPSVNLEWSFVDGSVPKTSTIIGTTQVTPNHDGTYDVTLTSTFDVSFKGEDRIPLQCKIRGELPSLLRWARMIELSLNEEDVHPTDDGHTSDRGISSGGLAAVVIFAVGVLCFVGIGIYLVRRRDNGNPTTSFRQYRGVPSTEGTNQSFPLGDIPDTPMTRHKKELREQLESYYKECCGSVKLPTDDKLRNVKDIFVEEGIEAFVSDVWQKSESYHHILEGESDERIILEGEAGYGKSILCLKMAHDWVTKSDSSPLRDVDILVFLHMRYLEKDMTICQAIKKYILPADTKLSKEDIRDVISSAHAPVVILDGFNRYPHKDEYTQTEVKKIMMKQAFTNCRVMLTTRSTILPYPAAALTKRMRLIGFDKSAQGEYISNVVAVKDQLGADRIRSVLREIPDALVFCQVPLFFGLLAHLIHQGRIELDFNILGVTYFVKQVISALNFNTSSGDKTGEEATFYQESFEELCKPDTGLLWRKSALNKRIGSPTYSRYSKIGILIEEEICDRSSHVQSTVMETQYHTGVKFYHNVFCEWFAAHYLASIAVSCDEAELKKKLQSINFYDHQYLFRFACGLDSAAAGTIIQYVESLEDGDKFAMLCIMEREGGIQEIIGTVKKLCAKPVTIEKEDSMLLQRSITQLLAIASQNEIPIEILWLVNMQGYYNQAREFLTLSSGINVPKLETLNQISITETGKTFTERNLKGIFQYASICKNLAGVRFRSCILPFTVDKRITKNMRDSQITVDWMVSAKPFYRLNMKKGLWEVNGDVLTRKDYQKIVTRVQEMAAG